jgi:hypothetical protein
MSRDQRIKKIDGIYELNSKKRRNSRYYSIIAIILFGVMMGSGSAGMATGMEGPIWEQPLIGQLTFIGVIVPPLVAMVLLQKSKGLSSEKKNFLDLYNAYKHLARYNSLKGCPSQERSDLERANKFLRKVSSELISTKDEPALSDVGRELDDLYYNIGELIQNRIIYALEKEKNLPQIEEHVLGLAETFSDNSFNRLQSLKDTLATIQESGFPKPQPSYWETHVKFKAALIHIGKLFASIGSVVFVAILLSTIFQTNISELTPYILASSFVLFVAWEFKSK